MLNKLIWKQWREHGWKLVFVTVIFTAYTTIGLRSRIALDEYILFPGLMTGAMLIPLFVAMGLIAPDRDEGSFATLMALPVRPVNVLAIITISGIVQCIVPLVCSALVALAIAGGRELTGGDIVRRYVVGGIVCVTLLVWTLSFSIRQHHESRVGLIGLAVVVGWVLSLMILDVYLPHVLDIQTGALAAVHPLVMVEPMARGHVELGRLMQFICAQMVITCLLWWWALRRMARGGRVR